MDSTGSKGLKRRPNDTEWEDTARRMSNIRRAVGCPHGRLYPETEACSPCQEYEASIMDPALD